MLKYTLIFNLLFWNFPPYQDWTLSIYPSQTCSNRWRFLRSLRSLDDSSIHKQDIDNDMQCMKLIEYYNIYIILWLTTKKCDQIKRYQVENNRESSQGRGLSYPNIYFWCTYIVHTIYIINYNRSTDNNIIRIRFNDHW